MTFIPVLSDHVLKKSSAKNHFVKMAQDCLFYLVGQFVGEFAILDLKRVLQATSEFWLIGHQEARLHPLLLILFACITKFFD